MRRNFLPKYVLSSSLSSLGQEANRWLVEPQAKKLLKPSGSLLTYPLQGFFGYLIPSGFVTRGREVSRASEVE